MILLLVIATPHFTTARIRILLTAALTEAHYEFRKDEYIQALTMLKKLGYEEFYIVEALKKEGLTFLDDYCSNVFYAKSNDPLCKNQGVNESRTILEAIEYFNFDPEDIIIKLTARHRLLSNFLLKTVENNQDCDAIFRYCYDMYPAFFDGMIPPLGFAMRCKYLCEMYKEIDYVVMEQQRIPLEWVIPSYIDKKQKEGDFKILVVDKLDMRANAFASAACPGLPENILFF